MKLNRIQQQIFQKLCTQEKMQLDDYLNKYSVEYIGKQIGNLDELEEQDADAWITKAYIKSLG